MQHAEQRRHRRGDPDAEPEAPRVAVERRAEHGRVEEAHGVGADGEEGRVAEVEQARVADDDVEPEREEHVDHAVATPRGRSASRARGRRTGRRAEPAERSDGPGRRASGAPLVRSPPLTTLSGVRSPSRPCGRNTSTRMRIEKTMALVQRAEMYWSLHAERKPMSEARRGPRPGMLPMPPRTAAVNARRPGLVAHPPHADVVVHALDQPGRAGQRAADEEGEEDRALDVDAHRRRGLAVLGGGAHGLAPASCASRSSSARASAGWSPPTTRRSLVVKKMFGVQPNHSRRMSTDGKTSGYAMGAGPFQSSAMFSSMNDTPMAVISGRQPRRRGAAAGRPRDRWSR